MNGDFRKKSSGIFITIFIGFIIVSFVITGYNGQKATSSTIGMVGDYKIDYSEFQNVYERQISLYRQIYGGKELTAKDIQQMQLRENIVKQLVQQKLILVFADKIGISPSQEEVKEAITNFSQGEQKIFQTNGIFNVDLYKRMLAGARITPAEFEKQNETNLKNKVVLDLISKVPLSKSFSNELEELKKKKVRTDIVAINKKQMEGFVPVSDNEISDYLAKNLEQVRAKFDLVKGQLSKPEEIKVKHILIYQDDKNAQKIVEDLTKNLNAKNFSNMAEKYNRTPQEKKNGGDLGWISKGKSVPEFFEGIFTQKTGTVSSPIKSQYGTHFILVEDKRPEYVPTFDGLKTSMAKEILQSQKPFEVEKMVQAITKEMGELLKSDKLGKAEELAKKYNLNFQKDVLINQLDGAKGMVAIPSDSLVKIFKEDLSKPKTFIFANPTGVSLIRATQNTSKTEVKEEGNTLQMISGELSQILANDITNTVKNDVKVSIYKFYE